MKVNNFITLFNLRTKNNKHIADDDITMVIKELIHTKSYISFDKKCKLVEDTINSVKNEKYKTAKRYYNFVLNLLKYYTDLEIDKNTFDILSENGLLDYVLMTFQSEYRLCDGIMTMYLQDEEGI